MSVAFPTLLVSRRPRQLGVDWTDARSWLGGAPKLGTTPWPRRGESREPLHFVAQIDLAEVAAKAGASPLPQSGSLAFFIGHEGAVIHVPDSTATAPTLPPPDMADVDKVGGSPHWHSDLDGRLLFPFWPVDFTELDIQSPPLDPEDDEALEAYDAALIDAVERCFPRRQTNLDPENVFAGPPIPDWWQTAIHYADYLSKAVAEAPKRIESERASLERAQKRLSEARSKGEAEVRKEQSIVAMYEANIAAMLALEPALAAFTEEVVGLSQGCSPWSLMPSDAKARLTSLWERNSDFAKLHLNHGKFPLEYLKTQMFAALPAAGTAEHASLPQHVRDLLDEKRRPRPQLWYMAVQFAKGLQRDASRELHDVAIYDRKSLDFARNRLAELRPRGAPAVFERLLGKKREDVAKLEAQIASLEAKLAAIGRQRPAFLAFVQETMAWTADRDPWSCMSDADLASLAARAQRAKSEFSSFTVYTEARLEDLEMAALRARMTGPDRAYATLPEPARTLINREGLLPPGHWHQMFGIGLDIQGASSEMRAEGYVLLLQLTYDDVIHWSFGDNGCYQFWISPADLANRNWAGVKLTFECH